METHTEFKVMQLSFKCETSPKGVARNHGAQRRLAELRKGEVGVLQKLDLPDEVARRLMELGFLPGHMVSPAHSAPGGDPRVFRVDGSEIALRHDTASRLWVVPASAAAD